jgi:hypothetical protein
MEIAMLLVSGKGKRKVGKTCLRRDITGAGKISGKPRNDAEPW